MNGDIYLFALYSVLGNMWEDYKLPKHLEKLWEQVDTMYNSKNINWELFYKDNEKTINSACEWIEQTIVA